jgi:hypothetical protein
LPKSVARAAASPEAIVLAGGGVAVGEAFHWGLPIALVLGAVGYSARVAWAAVRRRLARRRLARRAAIDPWSVAEPWRSYMRRALDARGNLRQLARDCAPGAVAEHLAGVSSHMDSALEELWSLARGASVLAGPPGRAQQAALELQAVQADLARAQGAARFALESRESVLASQLRSVRRLDTVAGQVSERMAAICSKLEGLVATAGELVLTAGAAGADLGPLSLELSSLNAALEDAKRSLPARTDAPGDGRL